MESNENAQKSDCECASKLKEENKRLRKKLKELEAENEKLRKFIGGKV